MALMPCSNQFGSLLAQFGKVKMAQEVGFWSALRTTCHQDAGSFWANCCIIQDAPRRPGATPRASRAAQPPSRPRFGRWCWIIFKLIFEGFWKALKMTWSQDGGPSLATLDSFFGIAKKPWVSIASNSKKVRFEKGSERVWIHFLI